MSLSFKASLISLLLSTSSLVHAQSAVASAANAVQTIAKPNGSSGWCYYCSDDDAPPLCNSQCTTAINRLCGENLDEALTTTEQDCQIQYMPPIWAFTSNGARQGTPSETDCLNQFNGILSNCGKDASNPASGVNATYCTTSGGGGTYGWNDDGSVIEGSARYIVTTVGTEQCGQSQALWQQATAVIAWDPNWIGPNDQVILETDLPAAASQTAAAAMASLSAALPTPNPECQTHECDIFDNPYYAESPQQPWQFSGDAGKTMNRHRLIFEGFAQDNVGSLALFHALQDRCQYSPHNWQVYKNGSQSVADFDLPSTQKNAPVPGVFDPGNVSDLCWCIPYAIYDASVGISLPVSTFCPSGTEFPSTAEFAPARKRGVEVEGGEKGIFESVDLVLAKRKRELVAELVE